MLFSIILLASIFTLGSGRNPCEGLNCFQICINYPMFPPHCGCLPGFYIPPDNLTNCEPKDKWGLLFVNKTINLLSDVESDQPQSSVQIDLEYNNGDITYDARSDKVFWIGRGYYPNEGAFERARLPAGNNSATRLFDVNAYHGFEFDEIALDWITGNLYFLDYYSRITICSNTMNLCTFVLEDDKPASLAIFPNQGIMVWLHYPDRFTLIMKSDLTGNATVQVFFEKAPAGTTITIDQGSLRVFWMADLSPASYYIKSVGLNGENPQYVCPISDYPVSMVIFGDRLYWIEGSTEINSVDKRTGKDMRNLLRTNREQWMNGLAVVSKAYQPISRENHCLLAKSKCSHICALYGEDSFRCLCPIGMTLNGDGKKCEEVDNTDKLVVAFDKQIKVMRWGSIGRDVFDTLTFPELKEISALAYHPLRNELILSDKVTNKIYGFSLEQKKLRIIIESLSIKGLGLDPVADNLYYAVDDYTDTLDVMSFKTLSRKVIIKQVGKITAIVVIPELGNIFFASVENDEAKIYKSLLNGEGIEIVQKIGDRNPVALAFVKEMNTLVWADSKRGAVETMSLNDSKIEICDWGFYPLSELIAYENMIFKIASPEVQVSFFNKSCGFTYSFSVNGIDANTSSILNLAFIHKSISYLTQLKKDHACSWENSNGKNCSHMCLPDGDRLTRSCHCPERLTLWRDGETCVDKSCEDAGPMSICANGSCVPGNNICDDDCAVGCKRIKSNGNIYFEIIVIITLLLILLLVGFCHLLSFVKGRKYYVLENKEITVFNVKQ